MKMEMLTVSKTLDTYPIFTRLITQEDFIAKTFLYPTQTVPGNAGLSDAKTWLEVGMVCHPVPQLASDRLPSQTHLDLFI
jgi:hypothetical protein